MTNVQYEREIFPKALQFLSRSFLFREATSCPIAATWISTMTAEPRVTAVDMMGRQQSALIAVYALLLQFLTHAYALSL